MASGRASDSRSTSIIATGGAVNAPSPPGCGAPSHFTRSSKSSRASPSPSTAHRAASSIPSSSAGSCKTPTQPHNVGLRLQLDTLIGSNDGVPFTVPGCPAWSIPLLTSVPRRRRARFHPGARTPRLRDPGTIAHMTLKVGNGVNLRAGSASRTGPAAAPSSAAAAELGSSCHNMGSDSAVVLYWPEKSLSAGQTRTLASPMASATFPATTSSASRSADRSSRARTSPSPLTWKTLSPVRPSNSSCPTACAAPMGTRRRTSPPLPGDATRA